MRNSREVLNEISNHHRKQRNSKTSLGVHQHRRNHPMAVHHMQNSPRFALVEPRIDTYQATTGTTSRWILFSVRLLLDKGAFSLLGCAIGLLFNSI